MNAFLIGRLAASEMAARTSLKAFYRMWGVHVMGRWA